MYAHKGSLKGKQKNWANLLLQSLDLCRRLILFSLKPIRPCKSGSEAWPPPFQQVGATSLALENVDLQTCSDCNALWNYCGVPIFPLNFVSCGDGFACFMFAVKLVVAGDTDWGCFQKCLSETVSSLPHFHVSLEFSIRIRFHCSTPAIGCGNRFVRSMG